MTSDTLQGLEQRIKQRETTLKHPLQTIPVATHAPHGNIPNTPLAVSTIAFLLGAYLLDNGAMYHIANGTALTEYLVTLYLKPSSKSFPYVTLFGM
ncbi:hypothetical protein C0995_011560 [Termitomyces sp. Mi166|nr:hypothetical protein C0995_011560 [Termitomyces sp. Mi166\